MPQPSRTDVHIDVALTALSTAYVQSQDNFVATKVFPIVPVEKQTNKYFTFTKDAWFRDDAQVRKSGEETAGSGFPISTDSYICDVFGIHKDIDDLDKGNVDNPLDLEQAAARFVTWL